MIKKFYINYYYKDTFINYQVFNTPYGGPRGKALLAFEQSEKEPIDHVQYLYYLKKKFTRYFHTIEWVRFHRFIDNKKHFAVAIMNVKPFIEARQTFYEQRNLITRETGWYPLIMGSKARNYLAKIDKKSINNNKSILKKLDMKYIRSIEEIEDSGTCIKINFETGNLILDVGFNCYHCVDNMTKIIFISHFHQDHSGSLMTILEKHSIPIVCSLPTYNSLCYIIDIVQKHNPAKKKTIRNKLEKNILIIMPNDSIKTEHGLELSFLETYHCPGSIGIKITDNYKQTIIYWGDLCLNNGFLNYSKAVKNIIKNEKEKRNNKSIFILDATFVKKNYDNIPYTQTPEEILELVKPGREIPNVWFISKQAETLIYLFLYFFNITKKVFGYPKKIFLDNKLITLLQSIWTPYSKKILDAIDPFLKSQYLKQKTNFIESHRIYPLKDVILKNLPKTENIIGFYSEKHFINQFDRFNDFERKKIYENSRFYLIGELASNKYTDLQQKIFKLNPISFEKLSSADWLFHSNQNDIEDIIRWAIDFNNISFILFHNRTDKLNQFIAENKFNNKVKCFNHKIYL